MTEEVAKTAATPAPDRARRSAKPRFRRSEVWVALKQIRVSNKETMQAGTEFPSSRFRRAYLFRLWRQNRIGPKGSPWTEFAVSKRAEKDAQLRERASQGETKGSVGDTKAHVGETKHGFAETHSGPGETRPAIELDNVGGGWVRVLQNGIEVAKVQGNVALNRWLTEHGYAPVS